MLSENSPLLLWADRKRFILLCAPGMLHRNLEGHGSTWLWWDSLFLSDGCIGKQGLFECLKRRALFLISTLQSLFGYVGR